jgi:hypothetical protein
MDKVRAKFFVQRIEKTKYGYAPDQKEMTTVVLAPVYSNEPGAENKKFWDATPTGECKLGTVNLEAAEHFELGSEYYIDFIKAEDKQPA